MKDVQKSNVEGFQFHGDANIVLSALVEHSLVIKTLYSCVSAD